MQEIKLTQGKVALVDDEDYEYLNQWKWYAARKYKTNRFIATRTGNISMHRLLMNFPKGKQIDHKDHNELNNQKSNLRICAWAKQNSWNRRKRFGVSSKYKGVTWDKLKLKWKSSICINGRTKHLGNFSSEIEAALTYNKAAKEAFGEFVCLNVVLNKRKEINNGNTECRD